MGKEEIPVPVTKEQVLSIAESASDSYSALKEKFPKTAGALLYSTRLKENAQRDDTNVLLARQAVFDISSGSKLNFENRLDHSFSEREIFDWEEINNLFEKIQNLVSSDSPDDLFSKVHEHINGWREELLSDEFKPRIKEPLRKAMQHPKDYDYEIEWRLDKYRELTEASEELVPELTSSPSEILSALDNK